MLSGLVSFLSIEVDPVLLKLVMLSTGIIGVGFILKLLKQPYIIGYIVAGVVVGPHGLAVITDEALISSLGSFGLILLLFFIGMEISLPKLIANWKVSVLGTLIQVLFSTAAVFVIGFVMKWSMPRIIMLGFVISLSSTAVVIKLLKDRNELDSNVGQNAVGILLAQDVIIVPMLIVLTYLSGQKPDFISIIKQIIGGLLIFGMIAWILKKKQIRFPLDKIVKNDHEIQVFIAFAICFGFAIITAFFGLSSALGAFVAGIFISSAKATKWVHESLHSFRVVFVALFFVSVGMLIDLKFLQNNIVIIAVLVSLVFFINNIINASVMRIFGESWRNSIYTGAILAQVGEFSFVLGASGYQMGMITNYTYQLIISIISLTLIASPFWIYLIRKIFIRNSIK